MMVFVMVVQLGNVINGVIPYVNRLYGTMLVLMSTFHFHTFKMRLCKINQSLPFHYSAIAAMSTRHQYSHGIRGTETVNNNILYLSQH